jgi:hypothetical protein
MWISRLFLACLFVQAAVPVSAQSDAIVVELQARTDGQQRTASGSSTATRPVLTATTGHNVSVQWSIVNQDKTAGLADVTVHCFLTEENAIGQSGAPQLGADVTFESALVMDFAPQAKSAADFVLQAPEPGNYLLRVETVGALKQHGHEHFAAMDVKVQRAGAK